MAYRFLIDSTRATLARFPGAHDVIMDALTDTPAALCPHYEEPICEGAYSWAPAIQELLEQKHRTQLWLSTDEAQLVVDSLRSSKGDRGATAAEKELAHTIAMLARVVPS